MAVLISFTFVLMRNLFIASFCCLFLCKCANIVPPNGGLKDNAPPILLKIEEEERSIRLVFDEYVQLKNQINFYSSPPLNTTPQLKTQKNRVIVEGDWQNGVNYSLHFSSVIADYNEGNLIEKLQIQFPRNTADTLVLSGSVKNALQNEASKDAWALLYEYSLSNPDSALYLKTPNYISKTDENGNFLFSNLSDTTYWLFALSDEDRNLKYNLPEENVGFYEKAVSPLKDSIEISLFNERAISDSLTHLKIDSASVFGKLVIDSLPNNHILEIMLDDKVIKRLHNSNKLTIDSLTANTYKLRLINDTNKNGVWDSGSLSERRQPEEIIYYPKEIQVRENWDLEISWKQ